MGIIHNLIGVAVICKVQIQPSVASESDYVEMRLMYKYVNKTKEIWRYMEALSLHTGAPTVHWEYNTSCISVVESKKITPRVKHINIPVYFLL